MNAKELQIGDLVDYRGKVIEVTSLYAKGGSNEVGFGDKEDIWVNGCVLNPIPLTPEILEKNGFEYCEVHRMYLYLDDFFDIKIRQYSDMMWEFTYCNNEMNLPDTQIAGIGYVHHLQHALKMVGVEQEITLT